MDWSVSWPGIEVQGKGSDNERSSQMNDVTRIDTKLASVDTAVMIDYQKQLQQLTEQKVSVGATEEIFIVEDGDEDELARGRDVGDGVWV
jgi:hypothetical protein